RSRPALPECEPQPFTLTGGRDVCVCLLRRAGRRNSPTQETAMTNASEPNRRTVLATTAAAGAVGLAAAAWGAPALGATDGNTPTRPFRVEVPDEALVDLRRRLAATRWPEKETVADTSQGVQLATIQALVRYWQTSHDWRKVEAQLNALPQFITEIDGL